MIRGTTPTHTFKIPFDTSLIAELRITYKQPTGVELTKCETDCTLSENSIAVKLTQEETLQFNHKYNVEIQVRILTQGGDVVASKVLTTTVEKCLNDEVLV